MTDRVDRIVNAWNQIAVPSKMIPETWLRDARSLGVFIGPLLLVVSLHWFFLDYGHPFGGQQSDDDYHFYSIAARFSASDMLHLPAYHIEWEPDRIIDVYDRALLSISFSNWIPYPGWTYIVHLLVSLLGISYPIAGLVLFVLQSALFIYGIQTLTATLCPAQMVTRWRFMAGVSAAGFWGLESFAGPLLSVPMNMLVALCIATLGLLVSGRWMAATLTSLVAVTMHVVAPVLISYVLMTWLLSELLDKPRGAWRRLLLRAVFSGMVALLGWALLYLVLFKSDILGIGDEFALAFETRRLGFLVKGNSWFFPIVGCSAMFGCWALIRSGSRKWNLPFALMVTVVLTGLGYLFLDTQHTAHPSLHPAGRILFYLTPPLLLWTAFAASGIIFYTPGVGKVFRIAVVVSALTTVCIMAWDSHRVFENQFLSRRGGGLGPLYERMTRFAADPDLRRIGFVFWDRAYGTVLSAAHLYHSRYFWAKVYSPERLEAATAGADRLVYLEGLGDPSFRVANFCTVSEEKVPLGSYGKGPGIAQVRLIQARRCNQ